MNKDLTEQINCYLKELRLSGIRRQYADLADRSRKDVGRHQNDNDSRQ